MIAQERQEHGIRSPYPAGKKKGLQVILLHAMPATLGMRSEERKFGYGTRQGTLRLKAANMGREQGGKHAYRGGITIPEAGA